MINRLVIVSGSVDLVFGLYSTKLGNLTIQEEKPLETTDWCITIHSTLTAN